MKRCLFIVFFLFIIGLHVPQHAYSIPKTLEGLKSIRDRLIETGVGYGVINSLYRPNYGRIMDANLSMDPSDPAFVVLFPDGVRIYPQRILVWHQVVNELIQNTAYAITYCPITGSLAAYQTTIDGVPLFFDAQGTLYDGNSVLVDRNTGSLWLQGLGMAFDGPLLGKGLPKLPVFWTTWSAASQVYPEAPVLMPPAGSRKPYGRDPYGNYLKENTYYTNDTLAYPLRYTDLRLPYKNRVLGLEIQNYRLAIDVAYVKKHGAVNFFLGELPLLAVHDPKLNTVRVYNRQVWNKPSLFIIHNGALIDIATKTTWDPATGTGLVGNMVGASMQQYFGMYAMWFSWYDLNPETFLIPGPGEVPRDVLSITPLGQ